MTRSDRYALVRQVHPYGCGIACLAMVTGTSYNAVHAEMVEKAPTQTLDLAERGIYHTHIEWFLGRRGFTYRYLYAAWHAEAWPPGPFAPVHIASVVQPSGNGHYVVLTATGAVLDPMVDEPRRLTEWPKVNNVLGVWPEAS